MSFSLLLIEWAPEVSAAEIERLTTAWGAKIEEKPVVVGVSYVSPLAPDGSKA